MQTAWMYRTEHPAIVEAITAYHVLLGRRLVSDGLGTRALMHHTAAPGQWNGGMPSAKPTRRRDGRLREVGASLRKRYGPTEGRHGSWAGGIPTP